MGASAIDRLAAARSALAAAERATGLVRAPSSLRPSPGAARPAGGLEVVGSAVVEAPAARSRLVRAVLGSCPDGGWAAFVGVADIGWEWAHQEGLDLDRVLVVAVPERVSAALVCSLCLDAVDVLCVGRAALSPEEQRRLAARARARGRRIITERPWPGVSRPLATGLREAV